MIYIDMRSFVPPADWLSEADTLTSELYAATTTAARKKIITDNAAHWGKLKAHLPFNHKCWFSEAINIGAPYHIEHFRPKNKVKKSSIAPFIEEDRTDWATNYGYWWLAFDWQNYRLSVADVNSSNKKNYFPLQLNSPIAYLPTDDYELEQPLLLDPTVQGDPDLLTFDADGKAYPAQDIISDIRHIRANVSIKIYGLNEIPNLKKARELKWSAFAKAVNRANDKYEQMIAAADNPKEDLADYYDYYDEFAASIKDIKHKLLQTSEYSAVAKACLDSYNYEWIEKIK